MKRTSCQSWQTLDQFYTALEMPEQDEFTRGMGRAMRELLPLFDQAFGTTPVWGLTSHHRLVLLSEDNFTSPWHVTVAALPWEYIIEYRMRDTDAPWPEATVRGVAASKNRPQHG